MATHTRIHQHTNTHTQRISFQTKPMTCARSAAGRAAARVLPRPLLVIHKLRLIPVVWCHLHHLPEGVIFNMGPLLFHRALCWVGGRWRWWWGVTWVLYLCRRVFICLCMCVCVNVPVWVCVRGREMEQGEKESVAMHFYTSSHWSLHMKHHGREELNTYSWAIFPVMQQHFSSERAESRSVYIALRGRTFPWAVLMPRGGRGLEPP